MEHDLKCHPDYFQAVRRGDKPFEIRKDDRPYRVGDALKLREWSPVIFDARYRELTTVTALSTATCIVSRYTPEARAIAEQDAYTGEIERVRVTYTLRGDPWVPRGHVAMGIRLMGDDGRARVQEDFVAVANKERARADAATSEAAALRQVLMNIRKDVHFAHRTVDSDGKWDALCEDVMRQIDDVTPNNTPGAILLRDYHRARRWARAWKRAAKRKQALYRVADGVAAHASIRHHKHMALLREALAATRVQIDDVQRAWQADRAAKQRVSLQSHAEWYEARRIEIDYLQSDLEETRRVNRALLEENGRLVLRLTELQRAYELLQVRTGIIMGGQG